MTDDLHPLPAMVSAAQAAIGRARTVFLSINVLGVILVACQFNGLLSWDRVVADARLDMCQQEVRDAFAGTPAGVSEASSLRVRALFDGESVLDPTPRVWQTDDAQSAPSETVNAYVARLAQSHFASASKEVLPWAEARCDDQWRKQLNRIYGDFNTVEIPLVGLKFRASDISVLGSVSMLLLALWFFYSVRRENHSIRSIVLLVQKGPSSEALARFAYGAIAHHFVFTTTTDKDLPNDGRPKLFLRWEIRALNFMPAWVPVVTVVADIISLYWPAWADHHVIQDFFVDPAIVANVIARIFIALAAAVISGRMCWRVDQFDINTREQMRILMRYVDDDPEALGG